jgi:hypothetical protein
MYNLRKFTENLQMSKGPMGRGTIRKSPQRTLHRSLSKYIWNNPIILNDPEHVDRFLMSTNRRREFSVDDH